MKLSRWTVLRRASVASHFSAPISGLFTEFHHDLATFSQVQFKCRRFAFPVSLIETFAEAADLRVSAFVSFLVGQPTVNVDWQLLNDMKESFN
jgi:hypothetical protein